MQIGIVGLPYTGKTTVFNALTGLSAPTGRYVEGQGETNRGVVHVPDERVEQLAQIYRPKKTSHASIEFLDVAGFKKGASSDTALSDYLLRRGSTASTRCRWTRLPARPTGPGRCLCAARRWGGARPVPERQTWTRTRSTRRPPRATTVPARPPWPRNSRRSTPPTRSS